MKPTLIRPILKKDNAQIAAVIRSVLEELESTEAGTTYTDAILDNLYEYYQQPRASFYVVELKGRVLGGGGVSKLSNYEGNVCELQKMYFLPTLRGLGFGKKILKRCIADATTFGYHQMYLETLSRMFAAQELYKKHGFDYIDGPLGDTGHFYCGVRMLKDL